jgi:phytoene dehydrogenase-like protein
MSSPSTSRMPRDASRTGPDRPRLDECGMSVTVLEANPRVGGMTSCHRPIPEAPEHLINSFSVDAFFWDAFPPSKELELERYGLRRAVIDPGHVYLGPEGESIAFWVDPARTAEEIAHFSRAVTHARDSLMCKGPSPQTAQHRGKQIGAAAATAPPWLAPNSNAGDSFHAVDLAV